MNNRALGKVDIQNKVIYAMDSMCTVEEILKNHCRSIQQSLARSNPDIFANPEQWQFKAVPTPQQRDTYQCGMKSIQTTHTTFLLPHLSMRNHFYMFINVHLFLLCRSVYVEERVVLLAQHSSNCHVLQQRRYHCKYTYFMYIFSVY